LKAQAAGVPLYRLLGGLARDRILAYASGGGSLATMEKTVEKVQSYASRGYRATKIAIAPGANRRYDARLGNIYGRTPTIELLEAGAVDIVQPDVTYCGGITAGLAIVALARAHHARVAFHLGGSFGPGLAASLALSLVVPECFILERVPATAEVQHDLCAWL